MSQRKVRNYYVGILCATLLLGSGPVYADLTEEACAGVKQAADDMQSQLPLSVDYATDLVGMVAVYAGGVCTVNYTYLIKTDAYAKAMAEENKLSIEQNIEWLKTDDGDAVLKEIFGDLGKESAAAELKPIASIPNMVFIYRHSFDESGIKPIRTVVMDTTDQ